MVDFDGTSAGSPHAVVDPPPPTTFTKMKPQTNDVALAVSTQVMLNEARNSNVVLSPASIQAMLSLIAAGANGPSLDKLLSFLKAESVDNLNSLSSELVSSVLSPDGRGPTMSFANGVWVDRSVSLRPSFKEVADEVYKAASWEVDFQTEAAKVEVEVNEWAKKHTQGKIEQVLPPGTLNTSTRIILANALYFKGAWTQAFDPSGTYDDDFHLSNGPSVRVPFMISWDDQFVSQFDGFKVLSLPYSKATNEQKFSMYIFLPDSRTGLPALVEKMGSDPGFLNRHIPLEKQEASVVLPKFRISYGTDIASGALKEMGLVLRDVDLSRMVGEDSGVRVSKVLHESFVEVNEEGTEAAAVTVVDMEMECDGSPEIEEIVRFVADHPFMFLIREDVTESVLFVGQVVDPSEEKKENQKICVMQRGNEI